jgi:hypothetical protein
MMKDKLNKYAKNITSQHGEDGILDYIIDSLGDKISKVCCEFGAWDGIFASNCYNFWHNKGWKTLLIEGDSEKYKDLISNTSEFDFVSTECCLVQSKGVDSLDNILKRHSLSNNLGVLSIDIDSFDYYVWKRLEISKPQIIIIEHNLFIPPYIDYHDPEDESYLRCSAKSLEKLGKEKGYKLICCTLSNCIFIRDDLFDGNKFPDYPVEYLFDYSAVQAQILMTGVEDNRYPILSKKISNGRKQLYKFYYKVQSMFKSNVRFIPPSENIKKNLKKFGLDA